MPKTEFVAGLDIGTNSIKLLAAEKAPEQSELNIVFQAQRPSKGVRRGVVSSCDEVSRIIVSCLKEAGESVNLKIGEVVLNVGGSHIFTKSSRGLASVSRADKTISPEDVDRVIQNARAFSLPLNKEFLETFPQEYIIDNESGIKEPIGMEGVRLEAEILMVGGFSPYLKNLRQAVTAADLDILDQVISPLASARAVLTEDEKESGAALVDIGAGTTGLAVFEEGEPKHLAVFPFGANNITNDIANGLVIDAQLAEKIKLEYGRISARGKQGRGQREIKMEIKTEDGESVEEIKFSLKKLESIIEDRVSEIFSEINNELKKIDRNKALPMGIVLTGGGAKTKGITELAKKELKLAARVGLPKGFFPAINDSSWSTVCGLVLLGFDNLPDREPGARAIRDFLKKVLGPLVP